MSGVDGLILGRTGCQFGVECRTCQPVRVKLDPDRKHNDAEAERHDACRNDHHRNVAWHQHADSGKQDGKDEQDDGDVQEKSTAHCTSDAYLVHFKLMVNAVLTLTLWLVP